MSNLVEHAKRELKLAGLYDKDSDYGGMIPENVLKCVEAFASAGHSGGSAEITLQILEKVLRFKTLTPITSDSTTWMERTEESGGTPFWQSTRDPSYFSKVGGKTFYSLEDSQ
jgi:hypothetical protein